MESQGRIEGRQGDRTYLPENEIPYLVVDESAFGKVNEAITVEIGIAIVQEGKVRHVQATKRRREYGSICQ